MTSPGGSQVPGPGPADPSVVDATLLETLGELDAAVNYRAWILDLARPVLQGPIVEVGAGHGTFTVELAEFGAVHALEPDPAAFARLTARTAEDPRVQTHHGTVDSLPTDTEFGSAVMINVLEHIGDDVAALRELHNRVVPGGGLAIWVPAFPLLFSRFDRELGHHRRYRRAGLVDVVTRAGWQVDSVYHVNLPGWFSWLLITRVLRQRPTAGPLVTIFDRRVVPLVRWWESRVRPPFGQSLMLTARKPSG